MPRKWKASAIESTLKSKMAIIIEEQPIQIREIPDYTEIRRFFARMGMKVVKGAIQSDNYVQGSNGWFLAASGLLAARGWAQTSLFSATGTDQVNWGDGTFTANDGKAYSIVSGAAAGMAAETYIYFDPEVSETAYQTTTDLLVATGAGRVLIAVAENNSNGATFKVLDEKGTQKLDGNDLILNSVTANHLAAALAYAGVLQIATGGYIHSGQTAWDTGIGFFFANIGGTPKASFGDSAGNKFTWNGLVMFLKGVLEITDVLNIKSYTVANLPIPPSTVGFNSPSASESP